MGVIWCAPWQIEVSSALTAGENQLEIEVANRWINRLIGDQQPGNKGVRQVRWDNGMLEGKTYPADRYTFTTDPFYKADSPLAPAGLIGPVTLLREPCKQPI
jgi:hypothetical protein